MTAPRTPSWTVGRRNHFSNASCAVYAAVMFAARARALSTELSHTLVALAAAETPVATTCEPSPTEAVLDGCPASVLPLLPPFNASLLPNLDPAEFFRTLSIAAGASASNAASKAEGVFSCNLKSAVERCAALARSEVVASIGSNTRAASHPSSVAPPLRANDLAVRAWKHKREWLPSAVLSLSAFAGGSVGRARCRSTTQPFCDWARWRMTGDSEHDNSIPRVSPARPTLPAVGIPGVSGLLDNTAAGAFAVLLSPRINAMFSKTAGVAERWACFSARRRLAAHHLVGVARRAGRMRKVHNHRPRPCRPHAERQTALLVFRQEPAARSLPTRTVAVTDGRRTRTCGTDETASPTTSYSPSCRRVPRCLPAAAFVVAAAAARGGPRGSSSAGEACHHVQRRSGCSARCGGDENLKKKDDDDDESSVPDKKKNPLLLIIVDDDGWLAAGSMSLRIDIRTEDESTNDAKNCDVTPAVRREPRLPPSHRVCRSFQLPSCPQALHEFLDLQADGHFREDARRLPCPREPSSWA